MFPSPYGEVGFDRWNCLSVVSKPSSRRFPSPYGEVGFDHPVFSDAYNGHYKFPSPYGEVGFDHSVIYFLISGTLVGFRPLTGKLVLIDGKNLA